MGKVFSWDEIKHSKIARLSSFSIMVDKIKNDLENTDGIVGAILCGSVMWSKHTERSDIDCVILYDPLYYHQSMRVIQGLNQFATDLYIPAGLIPLDMQIAKTPLHHISSMFYAHLECAVKNNGCIIKENPLPFILPRENVLEDIRSYERHKLRKLETGIAELPSMGTVNLYKFLQKMLEAPLHVARDVLFYYQIRMDDDSKQSVAHNYIKIASPEERELFLKVINADIQYTKDLISQFNYPNETQYCQIIENLKDLSWDVHKFLKLNALRFV